jgi:glycosyltransferase involved in cell wall biosynthesis
VELSVEQRQAFWKERGVSGFRGVCLNVSLDEPRKNLKTFFGVARQNPDVAFVRVGRLHAATQKSLDTMALQNVFHFNDISDDLLVAFYRNADLMLYPSFVEGFGLPPIEAIACGIPAVAVDSSGLAENLKGVVPLLKDPEDVEGFSQILRSVLDGKTIVDERAAQKLLERCSLEAFAKRLSDFLDTVVGRGLTPEDN